MDTIERWFDPRIPVEYITISFLVLFAIIFLGFCFLGVQKIQKFVLCILASEYYFLVLCSTVICRTTIVSKRIECIPFYKYRDIWNHVDVTRNVMEILLNIIMFIPIGLLIGGSMPKQRGKVLLIGCVLSIVIETLQLITGRGLCETDDVIHNTIGCLIGYSLSALLFRLLNKKNEETSL